MYKVNYSENLSDGSAIAIKYTINHKLYDDFDTDFLAVEVETNLGPIIIATTYLPPRRSFLPYTDMHKLLSNNIPTYIIGDFNGRHSSFGNRDNNTVGKSLVNLINQGKMIHLGPHFTTFFAHNISTNPDSLLFYNKHHYLNCICKPGEITSSDHLLIIFKLLTTPFITEKPKVYKTNNADWDLFKHKVDSQINVTDFEGHNTEQIEDALNKWIQVIENAMDTAIPKSNYQFIYQLKITPEIKDLQIQYKNLKDFATHFGWSVQTFREYQRIKTELRDRWKEAYNQNWEEKINISENCKNSKQFWNKIKFLKGNKITTTNYMKDNEGNKFFTDQEKCHLMEQTWKDVFRITEEEENYFDKNHSDHINSYINVNINKVKAFPRVNKNRINDNFHTREVTI